MTKKDMDILGVALSSLAATRFADGMVIPTIVLTVVFFVLWQTIGERRTT